MRSHRGVRARRGALAAAMLLAGCTSPDAPQLRPGGPPAADQPASDVLLRMIGPVDVAVGAWAGSELWDVGAARRIAATPRFTLPHTAYAAGWLHAGMLPPGRYFIRLRMPDRRWPAPVDLAFTVPSPPPPALYIGSFPLQCPGPAPCRVVAPLDESDAARELVSPAPVTRIAQPYPGSVAALGLPPPTAPRVVLDSGRWIAAIDWSVFGLPAGGPGPAPPGPRSDATPPDFAGLVSTAGPGAPRELEGLVALGGMAIILPALAVLAPVIIARHARETVEAERAAAVLAMEARERWGPCAASIAATLDPGRVEQHLRAAIPARAAAPRGAVPAVAWEATVTRVVFRRCGAAPDGHGIEVATRWTARRGGEAEPAYDAVFSRTVAAATPDRGLAHPHRLPFEARPVTEAACRPLADYCGAAGSALLLDEVRRGVTEARDAIAGGR